MLSNWYGGINTFTNGELAMANSPCHKSKSSHPDSELGSESMPESCRIAGTFKVSDFRNLSRLAEIPNDRLVELRLGKEVKKEDFGLQITVRSTISKAKVPGTGEPMPTINLISAIDFKKILDRVDRGQPEEGETSAFYDHGHNTIEVPVKVDSLSEITKIQLSANELKTLFVNIIHEMQHASGKSEFMAHRHQYDAEHLMGLRKNQASNLYIMRQIREQYPEEEVARALEEFESVASDEEFRECYKAGDFSNYYFVDD